MQDRHSPKTEWVNQYVLPGCAAFVVAFLLAAAHVPRSAWAGQAAPVAPPTFEVESIRAVSADAPPSGLGSSWGDVTGRVALRHVTLRLVLQRAFNLEPSQLRGPDWIASDTFDVLATVPAGATKEQIPLMFQSLLAERFGLRFHWESRTITVTALVLAAGGPKMQETSGDVMTPLSPELKFSIDSNGRTIYSPRQTEFGPVTATADYANNVVHVEYARISMSELAKLLTRSSGGRTIIDMTELAGYYRVPFDAAISAQFRSDNPSTPVGSAASDPVRDPLPASLLKLGLKMERQDTTVQTLVIDQIARVPTQN
jgi:uncharacterized protein (TIGR03435 family)